jgi:hypothetical protein
MKVGELAGTGNRSVVRRLKSQLPRREVRLRGLIPESAQAAKNCSSSRDFSRRVRAGLLVPAYSPISTNRRVQAG